MHNAIAATLVRLMTRDLRDPPALVKAKRRQALAIVEQHETITALVARGVDVGCYREAIR